MSSAAAAPLSADSYAPLCGAAVVALSEDHALLQSLTLAVIEQVAVVTCPSADRFVDQLVANGAEVALIDAATAPNPLETFLVALRRQFPRLHLVVVGTAQLQGELGARIADGTIFRFAHKPASAQRLKLLLYTAMRAAAGEPLAAGQTRRAGDGGAVPHAPGSPAARRPVRRAPLPGRRLWPLLLGLGALGALAGWYAAGYASQLHLLP